MEVPRSRTRPSKTPAAIRVRVSGEAGDTKARLPKDWEGATEQIASCRLELRVDTKGKARDYEVQQCPEALEETTWKAARRLRFRPMLVDDEPVEGRLAGL
jgi:hypothetical protein